MLTERVHRILPILDTSSNSPDSSSLLKKAHSWMNEYFWSWISRVRIALISSEEGREVFYKIFPIVTIGICKFIARSSTKEGDSIFLPRFIFWFISSPCGNYIMCGGCNLLTWVKGSKNVIYSVFIHRKIENEFTILQSFYEKATQFLFTLWKPSIFISVILKWKWIMQ